MRIWHLLSMAIVFFLVSSCATKPQKSDLVSRVYAISCKTAEAIYFNRNGFEISSAQKERINRPIDLAKTAEKILAVFIVGHSDASEAPKEKQSLLSFQRAKTIAEYVLQTYPELKDVVHFEGKGTQFPVYPAGHKYESENRRVEIEVVCAAKYPD